MDWVTTRNIGSNSPLSSIICHFINIQDLNFDMVSENVERENLVMFQDIYSLYFKLYFVFIGKSLMIHIVRQPHT